ncbi:Murein DD-endopeptidase MepM [Aliarcobacter thereius]|uniref:Murein DD-endopeptidase MepM n=1 Tax=Aliarcobacter thereius TaxID=544718 RepID=A0A1C0B5J1_9BACT|nr:M23 family metallopeptidase [Aliarcobacter thereius]OCL98197.1 Murein DD-endopeptidase MepM [Aliarcobacter thereius]
MKKIIFITLLITNIFAFELSHKEVKNANLVLATLELENIEKPRLSFGKNHYDFYINPFKKNSYYVLLPTSYYEKPKKEKVIISYIKDGKKIFKTKRLDIIDGNYKSEVLKVNPSKIDLSPEDKIRVEKEFKEAKEVYTKKHPNLLFKDDFILPLNSKITSDFGNSRIFNGSLKSYHSGTDFRAPNGTEIIASNSGIVRVTKDRFYGGNTLIIDHGHGIFSGYFHLSSFKVKEMEYVKKGQVIALSGSTGRVTGPHLHFVFRINNILVDPLQAMDILNSLKE